MVLLCQFAGAVFQAERRHLLGGWAEKHHALAFAALNKQSVFTQKPITRMYRLRAMFAHDGEQFVLIEIGFPHVAVT